MQRPQQDDRQPLVFIFNFSSFHTSLFLIGIIPFRREKRFERDSRPDRDQGIRSPNINRVWGSAWRQHGARPMARPRIGIGLGDSSDLVQDVWSQGMLQDDRDCRMGIDAICLTAV